MFNSISEILKRFTAAQRIAALLILVLSIVIITLGPSIIDSNTSTCDELTIRLKSQSDQLESQRNQIVELNDRIEELNEDLIEGQTVCTNQLIQKQREIMQLVNGMIEETQRAAEPRSQRRLAVRRDLESGSGRSDSVLFMRSEPLQPEPRTDETLTKLKRLKAQIQQKFINE